MVSSIDGRMGGGKLLYFIEAERMLSKMVFRKAIGLIDTFDLLSKLEGLASRAIHQQANTPHELPSIC